MKVGPIDLPVSNANQLLGFAILTVVVIFVVRMTPIPTRFKP